MESVIAYSDDRSVGSEELQHLFRQTTWARERSVVGIEAMLALTPTYVSARAGDRLVGFARTLTDGVYRALIDDVVVDERMRGQGIGALLVQRLLDRLRDVEEVFLGCSEDVVPFYAGLGFLRAANPYMKRGPAVLSGGVTSPAETRP